MATEETGTTGGIAGKENNSGEVPENEKKPLDERAPFSSPIIQLPPWAPAGNTPPLRSGNPTDGTPPVLRNALETDSPTETPFERNLREVGLKEALPHGGIAPDRVVPGEIGPESESGVARIRTYAADMGEEMKKRKATISSIISAEQSRPAPPPIESDASPKRRWGFIAGAFILALVGISALVWALFLRPSSPAPETRSSIISINRRAVLPIEPAKSFVERLAEEKNSAALNLGEIEEIEITKNGVPASPEDVLRALGAPSELARNATGIFVGIHAFNHDQPLLLITVSGYDFAFQGMLTWEPTLSTSLGDFYAPAGAPSSPNAPVLTFTDAVTDNIDVRKSNAEWPIIWGFPRQDLLIITTNESTLREVMTRLSLQTSAAQ